MLRRTILLLLLFFCLFNSKAQEKDGMSVDIDLGFLPYTATDNLGLFLYVEPKLKVSNSAFLGIRIGATVNAQTFQNSNDSQFIIDGKSDHGFLSAVPTYSYYWDQKRLLKKHLFRPYAGLGIGAYFLANEIDIFPVNAGTPNEEALEVPVNYQVGFLFKAGIEFGKSRLGLEYNFIPKTDIEVPSGQKAGTVDGSYWGFSLGFTF